MVLLEDVKNEAFSTGAGILMHIGMDTVELGFKVFRLSISWPRLFPTGEEKGPNEKGIAFYEDVLQEMQRLGIEPLVPLSHYEMPLELALKYNGWADRCVVELFVHFCAVRFQRFGKYVKYRLNFNEIDSLIRHSFTIAGFIPELCGERGGAGLLLPGRPPPVCGRRNGHKARASAGSRRSNGSDVHQAYRLPPHLRLGGWGGNPKKSGKYVLCRRTGFRGVSPHNPP